MSVTSFAPFKQLEQAFLSRTVYPLHWSELVILVFERDVGCLISDFRFQV
jgi:hypothetical protein